MTKEIGVLKRDGSKEKLDLEKIMTMNTIIFILCNP